ncbi:transcription repressor OFP2-like isoform X1 [Zingiber officinale]|nr:transcription repressor OFP2-like isoform X1 [Zingiber officinale]
MGNHRFRLSDIMPNTWFYKLRGMSRRARKSDGSQPSKAAAAAAASPKTVRSPASKVLPKRASCYFSCRTEAERFSFSPTHSKALDTQFPCEPHRNSKKRSRKKHLRTPPVKPMLVASSVSAGCRSRALKSEELLTPVPSPSETLTVRRDLYVNGEELEFDFESDDVESRLHSASCWFISSATDMDSSKNSKLDEFELESVSELKLPPILTKPSREEAKYDDKSMESNSRTDQNSILVKEQSKSKSQITNQSQKLARVSPASLRRLRMRANSPRLSSKKASNRRTATTMQQKKGLPFPSSYLVVKSSSDPQRDFRDSMMEMIVENNIRASKDLEELLACYLSLNSDEYHDTIVDVFQRIWFDLTNIKLPENLETEKYKCLEKGQVKRSVDKSTCCDE